MKKNEHGFGAIVILFIIVVGLIGAVGWLVYDRQKSSKQGTAQQSVKKSGEEPDKAKPEAVQSNYFEIKELGVKFELNDGLKGLYYSMGNDNKTAYFSRNDLKNTGCAADKGSQAALTRYTDADFDRDGFASKDMAKKIGDYYYLGVGGQSACSDDDKVQEKASQLRTEILKLLPSALQPIQ